MTLMTTPFGPTVQRSRYIGTRLRSERSQRIFVQRSTSIGNQLMFEFVRPTSVAGLILSLPPTALRQRNSPHLESAVVGRIGQNSNSPGTGPGGLRSVVAESLLVKQQLLILNRSRQRSPSEGKR